MTSQTIVPPRAAVRLRFQIMAFSVARMIVNTSYRMVYPFLPAIARGVGVPLQSMTLAITARSALGLVGPLLGSFGDLRGHKLAMLIAPLMFLTGMILVIISPTYPTLFVAMILTGSSKIVFDPSMQAYLGKRISYEQRGLALAFTEFGWSGAALVGIPVVGWLIERSGWNAPFPWFCGLGFMMLIILWRILPPDEGRSVTRPSFLQMLRVIVAHRSALAGLGIGLLLSGSNELVSIVYGSWMENSFGLKVASIGIAFTVVGLSELVGEGLAGWLADRLGKRRAVGLGLIFYTLTCLTLPVLGSSLNGALLGLFLFYLGFEYTLVCMIPLMTELVPEARATMMSSNITTISLGRTLGSLTGPLLFSLGFAFTGITAAVLNLIALILLLRFMHE